MIRIERNTDNLFSLLQFIAFVTNTFTFSHLTDAFIQSDLQGNVKLHRVWNRTSKLAGTDQQHYPLYQVTLSVSNSYIDITP